MNPRELTPAEVDAIAEYLKECHMDDMDADDMVFTLRKAWAERDSYKRKADALDKLEGMAKEHLGVRVFDNARGTEIYLSKESLGDSERFTAPNLLEAIELATKGGGE
jgi:hypothetical protein